METLLIKATAPVKQDAKAITISGNKEACHQVVHIAMA
jgi:hypothetical protein